MGTSNRALQRSWQGLSHPITVGMLLLMLLNDHVLRLAWPSWITGKLSDVAWLAFAPFIAAALLALFLPDRENVVGPLSFTGVAAIFALAKTVPAVHSGMALLFESVLRQPFGLRPDPTDLLALPGLAIGWWLWQRACTPEPRLRGQLNWLLVAFAGLATIGNMGMPQYGLTCLYAADNLVVVTTNGGFDTYVSEDNGLTWRSLPPGDFEALGLEACPGFIEDEAPLTLAVGDTQYRATDVSIDRSGDGGMTWTPEFRFDRYQSRFLYTDRTRAYQSTTAPRDLLATPNGNLLVAMGFQGILLRDPAGNWSWVSAGEYHLEEFSGVRPALTLLGGEITLSLVLALLVGLLLWSAGFTFRERLRRIGHYAGLVLAALAWLAGVLIAPALSLDQSYDAYFVVALLAFPVGISLLMAVFSLVMRLTRPYIHLSLWPVWLGAGVSAAAFLLPYVAWALTGVYLYRAAQSIALGLVTVIVIAGIVVVNRSGRFLAAEQASPLSQV
ncbi:MAG: hypothetical protein IT326_07750 [Anaerolineae bacterium]|nr:hypothetical protein [Anaerolineae bacterium]